MDEDIKKITDFTKWLEKYLTKNYGKRCPERYLGCCTCDVWKIFDEIKMLEKQIKKCDKYEKMKDKTCY